MRVVQLQITVQEEELLAETLSKEVQVQLVGLPKHQMEISWLSATEIRKRLAFASVIWLVGALTQVCSATGNLMREKV